MSDRPSKRVRVVSPPPTNRSARQDAVSEVAAPPVAVNAAAFAELPPYEHYCDEYRDNGQQQLDAVEYPTPEGARGSQTRNEPPRGTFGIRYHDQDTTNSGSKQKHGYDGSPGWRQLPQPQRTDYYQPRNRMDREQLEAVVWRGYEAPPQTDYYCHLEPRNYPERERMRDITRTSYDRHRQTDQYQAANTYQEAEQIETIPRHWPPQPASSYYYESEYAGPARGGPVHVAVQPRRDPLREVYVPPDYYNARLTDQIMWASGRIEQLLEHGLPQRSARHRGSLVTNEYPANQNSPWRHQCQHVAATALDCNAELERRHDVQAVGDFPRTRNNSSSTARNRSNSLRQREEQLQRDGQFYPQGNIDPRLRDPSEIEFVNLVSDESEYAPEEHRCAHDADRVQAMGTGPAIQNAPSQAANYPSRHHYLQSDRGHDGAARGQRAPADNAREVGNVLSKTLGNKGKQPDYGIAGNDQQNGENSEDHAPKGNDNQNHNRNNHDDNHDPGHDSQDNQDRDPRTGRPTFKSGQVDDKTLYEYFPSRGYFRRMRPWAGLRFDINQIDRAEYDLLPKYPQGGGRKPDELKPRPNQFSSSVARQAKAETSGGAAKEPTKAPAAKEATATENADGQENPPKSGPNQTNKQEEPSAQAPSRRNPRRAVRKR